jgi:hypothetical protein
MLFIVQCSGTVSSKLYPGSGGGQMISMNIWPPRPMEDSGEEMLRQ